MAINNLTKVSTLSAADVFALFSATLGDDAGVTGANLLTWLNANLAIGDTYTQAEVDALLALKAALAHAHAIGDVTGLQAALDLKAPLASPSLTGVPTAPTAAPATNTAQVATTAFVTAAVAASSGATTWDALTGTLSKALTIAPTAAAGGSIDLTKALTSHTISAATTLAFSGTPVSGLTVEAILSNDSATPRLITLPANVKGHAEQAVVASFTLPGSASLRIAFEYRGTQWWIHGNPASVKGAISQTFPTGADDTVVLVQYAPFAGSITSVVTQSDSGTATYSTRINGVALGGTANAVSSSEQSQAHSSANAFAVGDTISVVRTANSTCVNGRLTVLYDKA